MSMYDRILVASDLGPASLPALAAALGLADGGRARVFALHVSDRPREASHWLTPPFEEELRAYRTLLAREDEAARAALRRQVAAAMPPGKMIPVELLIRFGHVAERIIDTATELGAGLVVLGTHGRKGTLGSVAERVARDAGRPVLVVPSPVVAYAAGAAR